MTDKYEVFERVNELLENTGYPMEIKEISDLEDFLNELDNQQYEEYDEIEKLYNDLMEEEDSFEE
jgi:hypothetical protein